MFCVKCSFKIFIIKSMKERNFAEKILMIFSKGSNCIYYPINAINVDSHFKLKQRLGLG